MADSKCTDSANSSDDRVRFQGLEDYLVNSLEDYRVSSIDIACRLYAIYEEKLYRYAGYKNIYDYSAGRFGFRKSTVSEFLHVVKRFGCKMIGSSDWDINIRYRDYSISKLVIMSRMTDAELWDAHISPEDSVRTIREKMRKVLQARKRISLGDSSGIYLYYDTVAGKKGRQIEMKAAEAPLQVHQQTFSAPIDTVEEYLSGADKVADWLSRGWGVEIKVTSYRAD